MRELGDAPVNYPEEPKCALVLLLDTSSSMDSCIGTVKKIDELNKGIKVLKESFDDLTKKRLEIAVVTFGGTVKKGEFVSVAEFEPMDFETEGLTPMGEAILSAIDMVESRKRIYNETVGDYYRSWIWVVTDGYPTDMVVGDETWNEVVRAVHEGEKNGNFLFFTVGVGGADMEKLKMIAPPNRMPVELEELKFEEMFKWLSKSMDGVAGSKPGDQLELELISGWGRITGV